MFVNARKPLHVSVPFYSTILRLCAVTIMSSADLRSLSIYFDMWLYVYIICLGVCLVLLSVEDLFVNSSQQFLCLQTCFNILVFLNVKVSVF